MFARRPAVHPVEAPPPPDLVGQPTGVLMKDLPGMPGTAGGLGLRIAQFAFAGVALAVMASTNDSPSVSAFWFSYNTSPGMSLAMLKIFFYCF
ncbi:CASP-like protein 5A1 [Lolium perenne]|uniref:CASP-like protein 5A1 n=1 Tax=Lolium perenne TaxID=4522 RepID=UPI0021F53445|nr:CASP-like protein 5A1 [Lolium perenne]